MARKKTSRTKFKKRDSKPMMLNKHGVYVVDQRRYKLTRDLEAVQDEIQGLTVAPAQPTASRDSETAQATSTSITDSQSQNQPARSESQTPRTASTYTAALQAQRDAASAHVSAIISRLKH